MLKFKNRFSVWLLMFGIVGLASIPAQHARAEENLFGYLRGAETLPKGSGEVYQWFTRRSDKGSTGTYRALDSRTEIEYGVTDRFQVSAEINGMALHTAGIRKDNYLPVDNNIGMVRSGYGASVKYNFLSPAKDDFGLSVIADFDNSTIDAHSGLPKRETEIGVSLQMQKYFLEGQLVWVGNVGMRAAREFRKPVAGLTNTQWSTDPEDEIALKFGMGVSYRFRPGWSAGFEALHEVEYETGSSVERRSLFAGPNLHWAGKRMWTTLTYFKQISGGGEQVDNQTETNLHLVEKTKNEIRLKIGYNF